MKKILILLFGLLSINFSIAQTYDIQSLGVYSVTSNTAIISARAYAPSGVNVRAVLQLWPNSGTQSSTDSMNLTGNGSNPLSIQIPKSGLTASTTYNLRWLFKNVSTGVVWDSTTIENFATSAATTTAYYVDIFSVSGVGFFNALKVVTKINNGNQAGTFRLFYKSNDPSNPNWSNTAAKSFSASYADQYDTTIISGLTTVQYILQANYVPNSGSVISSGYIYGTPLAITGPDITQISSTPQYDTFNASVNITLGNVGGEKVFMRVFDSLGNLSYSTPTKPGVNGINYFNTNNWQINSPYGLEVVVFDTLGNRDSLKVSNGWRTKIASAVTQLVVNSLVKATTAWFDIKLTNNDYFCATQHTYRYKKRGAVDWEYGDTITYTANNSVRRISLTDLDFSSSYDEFILTTINCSGVVNEYLYPFTTKAPMLPPTITKPSADGGCGFVRLNPFGVIPRTGDTSYVEVWVAIEPDVLPTTLVDAFYTDDILNYSGVTYSVPAGKTATFFIVAASKDDSATYEFTSNRANPLDQATVNRAEVSKTDSTINVSVFGGRGCGDVIKVKAVVREYNSWAIVKTIDDITAQNVPATDQYTIPTLVIGPDLKSDTKYYLEFGVSNDGGKNWYYSKELIITTAKKSVVVTSGITSIIDGDIWNNDPIVTAYDLIGRMTDTNKVSQLHLSPGQVFILKADNGETKKVVINP